MTQIQVILKERGDSMLTICKVICTKKIYSDIKGIGITSKGVRGGFFNRDRKIGDLDSYNPSDFTLHIYDTEDNTTESIKLLDFIKLIDKLHSEGIIIDTLFMGVDYTPSNETTWESGLQPITKYLLRVNIRIITKEMYRKFLRDKLLTRMDNRGVLLSADGLVKNGVFRIPEGVIYVNPNYINIKESVHTIICPDSLIDGNFNRIYQDLDCVEVKCIDDSLLGKFQTAKDKITIICREDCVVTDEFIRRLLIHTNCTIESCVHNARVETPSLIVEIDSSRKVKRTRR